MITLFQPPGFWGIANISPACMKLETWLRMAGIPYQIVPPDLSVAPKGKIPYIDDEGTLMGDSTLIIEHLSKKHNKDLDQGLSSTERAIALAFRRMLKEHTYFVISYSRYADEANWQIWREPLMSLLMPNLPREIQEQGAEQFRGLALATLKAQGVGRHNSDEVNRLGIADVAAIADYLADKPFFMGENPTLADATIYAYMSNLVSCPLDSHMKQYALSRTNLVEYLRRMQGRFFP